ncbi:MAG TPA: 30S ribosomal protein S12 methylthiotransferase RimO, partial [Treponemataceae bacterium]|nr:30S ribosomal protein S12 methylthiotransferase RimO [Treponemataceae bacterium]
VPTSRLALGRAWFQAPEVDGAVVLQFESDQRDSSGKPIDAGSVVSAVIMAVNGVDVEAVVR